MSTTTKAPPAACPACNGFGVRPRGELRAPRSREINGRRLSIEFADGIKLVDCATCSGTGAIPADLDWRDLPPMPAEEIPAGIERIAAGERMPSMTFLEHFDRCERSALLYRKWSGGAGGHELNRGDIAHRVFEALTRELMAADEPTMPPERGKDRLLEELAAYPGTVPARERDALREIVFHWCTGWGVDPGRILGVEQEFVLEVGRHTVRGKIDLVTQATAGMIFVDDYKTSFAIPDSDDFERGGLTADGKHKFGGNFQTIVYALAAVFGTTPDGLALGTGVERVRMRLIFPRLRPTEEGIPYVEADVGREQLTDYRFDLEHLLDRLDASLRTRKWQPTPGDHCYNCPAEPECPLPPVLRPELPVGDLETIEGVEREAARHEFMARRQKARKAAIKAAAKALDLRQVRVGHDIAFAFVTRIQESIKSKVKLRRDVDAAVQYGQGLTEEGEFDWERHVSSSTSTPFDRVKVAAPAESTGAPYGSENDDEGTEDA